MLVATKPERRKQGAPTASYRRLPSSTVQLFRGCVQQGLFSHVHDATIRTLGVNGYEIREIRDQVGCGAFPAPAGLLDGAPALARRNVAVLGDSEEPIVV